jgi:pyruvate,water dikinase
MERYRDIVPPGIIYGDEVPDVQDSVSAKLTGTPTSRGRYSGPVRVAQGIQDLHKVQEGDVLVIPYADVGWTPLFMRAGAVIAESGGLLSHSSIIAREYNIPAVVSVAHACRLADGTTVTVDGYQGEITIHEHT